MGTIEQQKKRWASYDWSLKGDDWSEPWGGTDYEWWGTLFPRIHEFLPAGTVLEIGQGYGRWTRYLVHLCDRLIGVELVANCVETCRQQFADYPHASFHLNDGASLDVVVDGSVDFAFSFDSLVHAERDVLERYIHELARKLAPDGVGFIHHSNLGQYVDPATGRPPFTNVNGRARSMTAPLFEQFCRDAGLACIGQELVNWGMEHLNDCFSLIARPGSRFARPNRVRENRAFMEEAATLGELAGFYGPPGFPGIQPTPPGEKAALVLRRRLPA